MAALVGQTAERIFTKLSHVVDIRSCIFRSCIFSQQSSQCLFQAYSFDEHILSEFGAVLSVKEKNCRKLERHSLERLSPTRAKKPPIGHNYGRTLSDASMLYFADVFFIFLWPP